MTTVRDESASSSFRSKVSFMKLWKPENIPSNRDRLELYALHKQAISGDAPNAFSLNASLAEKSRYQAWKSKRGLSSEQAMTVYCTECDRQVRIYGGSSSQNPVITPKENVEDRNSGSGNTAHRGISAIPLLCAAAAESRVAYLRRLNRSDMTNAWWSRQEALCGSPGTIATLPESLLLAFASLIEYLSMSSKEYISLPDTVVQSFLWPLHNISLGLWVLVILIYTAFGGALHMSTTILWGSRRTGLTLSKIWDDEITPTFQTIKDLSQSQHPIGIRLMSLMLWPYTLLAEVLCLGMAEPLGGTFVNALVYTGVMLLTWWYWIFTVPGFAFFATAGAFWSGFCFAAIELAGI
eukprot:CAMPEP_0194131114 /NCGR_PEP_ID=MMETSP0152-20130528/1946_1 /TAXON_ID=1049557 /ORGANISM="Thalassiothrix antarctica, Strain L6-D1" /LENGTH=351 /DNA_ID=CAMNT_0038825787 /DNA_START=71 /DNA_END=1126 /DNA_ORIENTATION=+